MKARVLKNNKVIKVYRTNQQAFGRECKTVWLYKDYNGKEYWGDELERVPDDMPLSDDAVVTISKLREILLDIAMPTHEFRPEPTIARTVNDIINRVKESI